MSLGGQEDSAAVIVYGPDGKAYGSPAQAKAAGVSNPTMSPPAGAPSSAPGAYSAPTLEFSTPNIMYAPPMTGPAPSNPMGEASAAVITYGPDGRAYGSPAEARNAGVSNPTMSPPAGVPISYPVRQPYTPAPLPSIPTQLSGGRNRYAEIMAQYAQSQPFSFFGYPQNYTDGFTANPSTYTGGFTPYQRLVTPQPALPVVGTTSATAGGGGGGANRETPSAWSQMTPAERAAYYSQNPTEGKIALGMQDLFGNATLMGQAAKYFGNDGWYDSRLEKMGINPTISLENQNTLAGEAMQRALDSQAQSQATQAAITAANVEGAGLTANPMSRDPSQGGNGGGGYSGAPSGGSDVGRSPPGSAHDGQGGSNYSKGGHVSMMHLQGPNPMGPDDGYGALKDGEYVINDKAVKKYGIELMDAINSGKISKGKLRGLLEM